MKLNLQQTADESGTELADPKQIVLFGVSDFQIDDEETATVFFPARSGFSRASGEVTIDGKVTAALEETVLDDLTYEELLIESITADSVIVVYSADFPRLPSIVELLPDDVVSEITVVEETKSYSELPV